MIILIRHSEVIRPHFDSLYIKMLCAIIDNRIEQNLPNMMLRRILFQEIAKLGKLNAIQSEVLAAMVDGHDWNKEESLSILCTAESGIEFTIDLANNLITWDTRGCNQSGQIEYGITEHKGILVRTVQGKIDEYETSCKMPIKEYCSPMLFWHNIVECSDFPMLDMVFRISEEEYRVYHAKVCPDCNLKTAMPTEKEDDFIVQGGDFDTKTKEYEIYHHVTQYQCDSCRTIFYKA